MNTGSLFLNGEQTVSLTYYLLNDSDEMKNTRVRPAVLVCPGGGYKYCSDREAEPIALSYLAEGYNAFVLRYSLGEKAAFPQPLRDAEAAMRMIADRAEEWHVDPARIAAAGFSAGGHLAASLGTMSSVKPSALILCYPCITAETCGKLSMPVPSLDDKADAATPPAFIFHTWADGLVPVRDSLVFAEALDKAKVPCEMHIYQRGGHGLSLAKPHTSSGYAISVDDNAAGWFRLSVNWLQGLWGDFPHNLHYDWE